MIEQADKAIKSPLEPRRLGRRKHLALQPLKSQRTKMENLNSSRTTTQQLVQELTHLKQSDLSDDAERLQVKEALSNALARLETPWEASLRIVFTHVCPCKIYLDS